MTEDAPRLLLPGWLLSSGRSLHRMLRVPAVWLTVLAVLQLPGIWLVLRTFYPGRANIDIVHQARQAMGQIPYDDWHPPVMSALWEVLRDLTGSLGPLFLLQIGLYFLCGWLIAVLLYERTGRRAWSLFGVAFPLLPHTIAQIGMLWKDTQMACALLAGTLLLLRVDPRRPRTLLWWIPALVLVVYATAVRKNAVFAIVPLVILIGWQLAVLWTERRRGEASGGVRMPLWRLAAGSALAAIVIVGAVQGLSTAVNRSHDVAPTGQLSQVFLDDVIFSVPAQEIEASRAPDVLKEHLLSAQRDCLARDEIWDAYWNCYGHGASGEPFSAIAQQDELRALWLETVPSHPVRYLKYRTATYADYLSSSRLVYWPADWDGEASKVGLGGSDQHLDRAVEDYVVGIGVETLPWLFRPWFWFATAVALLLGLRRIDRFRTEIAVLSGSGLAYMIGYFPIIPADHYRYTYWPALAITLGAALFAAAWNRRPAGSPRTHPDEAAGATPAASSGERD